ncbi:MAG: hypothetical protein OEU26_15530 [Candidatus Tectomicrobia bacterium]|nr:hypothetical protein [Candidatus Tectomicrobia bacterium]
MSAKTYQATFSTADYLPIDTWMCRCELSTEGKSLCDIRILVTINTLRANAVSVDDRRGISMLSVQYALETLPGRLEKEAPPKELRVPENFVRSPLSAQTERVICDRLRQGESFQIIVPH